MRAADQLIKKLALRPHPEGGYYRETYRSSTIIYSPQTNSQRNAMTHIYFLLAGGQISRMHRVAHDEIWIFLEGADLLLHTVDEKMHAYTTFRIGSLLELESLLGSQSQSQSEIKRPQNSLEPAAIVAANRWQAAESTGDYSLVSCIVAPGFDFQDFQLLTQFPGDKDKIKKFWPELARFI